MRGISSLKEDANLGGCRTPDRKGGGRWLRLRLVEEKKVDYIGKEALARIEAEGVKRKLVGIELPGEPIAIEC